MLLSSLQLYRNFPDGWNATPLTQLSWPVKVVRQLPLHTSHNLIVLSREPEATISICLLPGTFSSSVAESGTKTLTAAEFAKATHSTTLLWPVRVCMGEVLSIAQTITASSLEQVASRDPCALTVTLLTHSLWPLNVLTQKPVLTSQSFIVRSRDDVTRKSPAGKISTQLTLWSWPLSVLMHSKVSKLHSLTVRSAEALASKCPVLGSMAI
mmetsp:Transcript_10521/g.20216  ORF Transcript_10521/g.20216 Transcript_10521/m.20216 type:complete len:211 (+) Transcript_10521:311-943(+)